MGGAASRAGIEGRMLELGGRLVEVRAPAHWSDARTEAWLDWAEGERDLVAFVTQHVEALARRAQGKGLLKDLDPVWFRGELMDALLTGAVAFAPASGVAAVRVVEGSSSAVTVLEALESAHRGRAAADAAARALAGRLQGVIDAVLRCEGEREACADPAHNITLARAAEAAR